MIEEKLSPTRQFLKVELAQEEAPKSRLQCYELWFTLIMISSSFIMDTPMVLSVPLQKDLGTGANFIQICYVAWWASTIVSSLFVGQ